jgi:M6 family metalloprotease-like protein
LPLKTDHRRPRPWSRGPAVLPVFILSVLLVAEAVAGPRWERLPARRWTWDQVVATTGGRRVLDDELQRQGETVRRWRAVHELLGEKQVSRKSQRLLAERGLGPALLAAGADRDKAAGGIDTLRVLFVRIAFDGNRDPNLTTIPAGGDFMLDPLANPGPLEVDPPPHNKRYFESHLQGLTEYYRFMSGRRLHIEGQVLPAADQAAYRVQDIAEYGPGAGNFWTMAGLESLVRDMITATDLGTAIDGTVNLADYDDNDPFTYVIFVHAGSDWQSDVNGDSPNDVPTFFVNLGEAQALTSIGSDGVAGSLTECSVIPETTNQDGYAGSIAAAFYHEFGHALGLPDVYDSSRGLPSVGIWDLMDSGTNLSATLGAITAAGDTVYVVAGGVLPPSLSAWDKWFLGWLETRDLDYKSGEYRLPAVGVPREDYAMWAGGYGAFRLADPQAWRGGLSPREWFLIENRWVPSGNEPLPWDALSFERDDSTGVILYLAGHVPDTEVWENSGLYDYFLPAGGALVWHVNADRIEAGLESNTINTDGDGLKLVEADGLQDIGVLDAYVLGWYGSWRDPFGGRDLDGVATGYNSLPADGFPNTRLHDRSWSHLALSNIGPYGSRALPSVMKFEATLGRVPPGLPWTIASEAESEGVPAGPRAIDPATLTPLEVSGTRLLLFTDAPGANHGDAPFDATLYAVTVDGREWWPRASGRPLGGIFGLGGRVAGSPVALAQSGGGTDLIITLREGSVRSVSLGVAAVTAGWQMALADSLVCGAVPLRAGPATRLACAAPDRVYLATSAGAAVGTPWVPGEPLDPQAEVTGVWPIATDVYDRLCVTTRVGWYVVGTDGDGWTTTGFNPYPRPAVGAITAAVVPVSAIVATVHVFDDLGAVGAWRLDDELVEAADHVAAVDGPLVCAPAVADVDGDGLNDLVAATATRVCALKADGIPLRGWPRRLYDLFPLADTTRIAGPLVVADATGDGHNEIFFNTDGGHLMGLGPDGTLLEQLPLRWGDRRQAGFAVGDGTAGRLLWLVSGGGYTSPPMDRTWVNGRVAAWQIDRVLGTSEWLGPGGSIARSGPAGTAVDLGSGTTAALDRAEVALFPNPASGEVVNARFWSDAAGPARLAVYDLQGELVREGTFAGAGGQMNQVRLELPGISSGMYVVVLDFMGSGGRRTRTMTLAVER